LLGSIIGSSWGRKRKRGNCGILLEDSGGFPEKLGCCWDNALEIAEILEIHGILSELGIRRIRVASDLEIQR
jgi:hypothetical protein